MNEYKRLTTRSGLINCDNCVRRRYCGENFENRDMNICFDVLVAYLTYLENQIEKEKL